LLQRRTALQLQLQLLLDAYTRRISRRRDAIVLATDVTGKMYTEQSSSQRGTLSLHRAASSTLSAAAAETANSPTLVLTEVAKRTLQGADHSALNAA